MRERKRERDRENYNITVVQNKVILFDGGVPVMVPEFGVAVKRRLVCSLNCGFSSYAVLKRVIPELSLF